MSRRDLHGDGISLRASPGRALLILAINTAEQRKDSDGKPIRNPLSNRKLRQAVNLVIDRAKLQRVVFGGEALSAGLLVGSDTNGYIRRLDQTISPSISRAKKLLNPETAKNVSLRVACVAGRYRAERLCPSIASDLARIGFKAQPQILAAETFNAALSDRTIDLAVFPWATLTDDSADLFENVIHSKGRWNIASLDSPQLDKLIEQLSGSEDAVVRSELYAPVWKLLNQTHAYLPLVQPTQAYALKHIDIVVDANGIPRLSEAKLMPSSTD